MMHEKSILKVKWIDLCLERMSGIHHENMRRKTYCAAVEHSDSRENIHVVCMETLVGLTQQEMKGEMLSLQHDWQFAKGVAIGFKYLVTTKFRTSTVEGF